MSHFTVLVIGPDFEKQLAPYHEFECTGANNEFVIDKDITGEIQGAIDKGESLEEALGGYGLEDKIVDDESKVRKVGDDCEHKYGYAIVKDGKLIKAVNRTNPNRKWDWWQVGGRWSGFFKVKEGRGGIVGKPGLLGSRRRESGGADMLTKADVDFEGMRDESGQKAAALWDKAAAAINGQTWRTWEQVRTEDFPGDIVAARKAYHAQPAVEAIKKAFSDDFWVEPDQFLAPRDQYIQRARDASCTTFAMVKDGKWHEKGEMGWWGMSTDKVSQDEWNAQMNKLLDELPPETPLTLVDCHI